MTEMCKPGNSTIFRRCAEDIRLRLGRPNFSNQEAQELLRKAGGCLNHRNPERLLDKAEKVPIG